MEERRKPDRRQQDRLLTEHQVADMAAVPVATVRYWRYVGMLPFVRIGRHPRIWLSAFQRVFQKPLGLGLDFAGNPDTIGGAGDIRRGA